MFVTFSGVAPRCLRERAFVRVTSWVLRAKVQLSNLAEISNLAEDDGYGYLAQHRPNESRLHAMGRSCFYLTGSEYVS
jgi:hypothetical protein